jgi:FKBP-type peptidyl-prolyl cis-trans isomerase
MKQAIKFGSFIVIAAIVIGGGAWYANHISEESQQSVTEQGVAAQQTQAQIMQNLKITDITVGTGAEAENGETLSVLYSGTLDDGKVFDASSLHGNQPFSFVLGQQQVIEGWDLGVVGMKVGGKRELTIPPELGYGAQGQGPIPPNATLHFTITLLSVSTSSASSTGN